MEESQYILYQKGVRIATWNVMSTYEEGALRNLVEIMKSYKIDILALQETKQNMDEITEVEDSVLFNSRGKIECLEQAFY